MGLEAERGLGIASVVLRFLDGGPSLSRASQKPSWVLDGVTMTLPTVEVSEILFCCVIVVCPPSGAFSLS